MKKKVLTSIFALAFSLAFVSGVMAESKSAPQAITAQGNKLEKFSGVVEKVDGAGKNVFVEFHKEKMAFSLADHAKIMEGNKEMPLTDLKKGMWASVEYKKEGNQLLAESMNVSKSKMPPKKENISVAKKNNASDKNIDF